MRLSSLDESWGTTRGNRRKCPKRKGINRNVWRHLENRIGSGMEMKKGRRKGNKLEIINAQ